MDDFERHADAIHNIRAAIRYHMRRQGFFERWHRVTGVLSLIFSSAAVVSFVGGPTTHYATIMAAIVAITQAIDLMFETQKRATLHADLRRRYVLLEPDLLASSKLTEPQYAKIKRKIASIEIDEPPLRETLIALAQNEAAEVSGYTREDNPASFTELNWWQRHFPNLNP